MLVADDGSTDATGAKLIQSRATAPFLMRLFRIDRQPKTALGDASLAENVLLRETPTASIVLHADDDGGVHPDLVKQVKEEFARMPHLALFGVNEFIRADDSVFGRDSREVYMGAGWHQLNNDKGSTCGALWAAPAVTLRRMGGHDWRYTEHRGCDSRLGSRLCTQLPVFFVNEPWFTFRHFGHTARQQINRGELPEELAQHYKTVGIGTLAPGDNPAIANGGEDCWTQPFPVSYREF